MQRTSVWAYTGAARYLPGMLKVIRKTFKNQFEVQVKVVPGKTWLHARPEASDKRRPNSRACGKCPGRPDEIFNGEDP